MTSVDDDPYAREAATGPRRSLILVVAAQSIAVLPALLVASLAVFLRPSLDFGEAALGLLISVFFLTSAVMSVPGGRLAERLGSRSGMRLGAICTAVGLVGISATSRWEFLLPTLCVAGIGNGLIQPAGNLRLSRSIPDRRLGLAFGLKQAAVPVAAIAAGLAVPIVAGFLGWRSAFLVGAAATGIVVIALSAMLPGEVRPTHRPKPGTDGAMLIYLAISVGLGGAVATGLSSFLVESTVAAGFRPSSAGWLLGLGSATSVVARVWTGWLSDRRGSGHLSMVIAMMLAGAVGLMLMGIASLPATPFSAYVHVAGALMAFAFGWGWVGVFNFAVVSANREAPAAATGVTQTGLLLGGAIGPLAFGAAVQVGSYAVAWFGAAAVSSIALILTHFAKDNLDGSPGTQPTDVTK